MPDKLPIKLKKEPLCDAVFEVRFSSATPVASILPGIFYSKLEGKKTIQRLPAAELPQQIRDSDPNLQYAPVMRIRWEEFIILISDRSSAMACNMPYPGWEKFKKAIITMVGIIAEVKVIETIQRYSMKYIDLIQVKDIAEQIASVELKLNLGDHKLEKEVFQFRIEIADGKFINAVQIVSSGFIETIEKVRKEGLVIDIDTIRKAENLDMKLFLSELPERLEDIHFRNKIMFFKCLTPAALKNLEPVYE